VRLFVGIEAPETWRDAGRRVQEALPPAVREHARIVDPGNMHLTLRFIGEVEARVLPALQLALAGTLPPVALHLELTGIGTFGAPARTSVAWLGVGGDIEALHALASRADEAVATVLGSPLEERGLQPHITLARVRRQATPADRCLIAEAVAAIPLPPPLPFEAREAVLIESHLGSGGSRYEVLGRWE